MCIEEKIILATIYKQLNKNNQMQTNCLNWSFASAPILIEIVGYIQLRNSIFGSWKIRNTITFRKTNKQKGIELGGKKKERERKKFERSGTSKEELVLLFGWNKIIIWCPCGMFHTLGKCHKRILINWRRRIPVTAGQARTNNHNPWREYCS